jgi:membrane protein implicated in regulation of membrane protease activity
MELIISLVVGVAAYILARHWANRMDLDPKPRGALVLMATILAGISADVLARMVGKL